MKSSFGTESSNARKMLYSIFADVTSTIGTISFEASSMSCPRMTFENHALTLLQSGSEPVTFSLKYNVMPYVGLLTMGEAARTTEPLPFPPAQAPTE